MGLNILQQKGQLASNWFITGLSDGDGSFYISITKNNKLKVF